jgi:hypothetical protein
VPALPGPGQAQVQVQVRAPAQPGAGWSAGPHPQAVVGPREAREDAERELLLLLLAIGLPQQHGHGLPVEGLRGGDVEGAHRPRIVVDEQRHRAAAAGLVLYAIRAPRSRRSGYPARRGPQAGVPLRSGAIWGRPGTLRAAVAMMAGGGCGGRDPGALSI